jgi:hypothetical protein
METPLRTRYFVEDSAGPVGAKRGYENLSDLQQDLILLGNPAEEYSIRKESLLVGLTDEVLSNDMFGSVQDQLNQS